MYEASEKSKRSVLEDLGLHDISRRIVLVPIPGTKADYRLAKTEEELEELLKRQETGQLENTCGKYLRPLLRKAFPPAVTTGVSIKTQRDAGELLIPAVVSLYVITEKENSEVFLQVARTLGFQTQNYAGSEQEYASLDIDVSDLNGDRKSIVTLIRRKLQLERQKPP